MTQSVMLAQLGRMVEELCDALLVPAMLAPQWKPVLLLSAEVLFFFFEGIARAVRGIVCGR